FDEEIIPITSGNQTIDKDGCIRPGTDLKTLAELKPAFDANGSVTAGTASPLTDGAACVLVVSEDYAKAHGLAALARLKSVAVAGAGLMGAGIAAQIANAGIPVDLLDVPPKEGRDRDAIAKGAIERILKGEPAALMHRDNAQLIRPGNIEDHLDRLKGADWIVEAVVENLAVKQSLYRRLAAIRKQGAIVSSNTSTILLKTLAAGLPGDFAQN